MGKISVTFVAVCTFIFLTSQASQTESTRVEDDPSLSSSSNEDNGDLNSGQRKVTIDGYAGSSYAVFESKHLDPTKDQYRYKTNLLACESDEGFGVWNGISMNQLNYVVQGPANVNVTFQIQDKTTGKIIGTKSIVTPAEVPAARVTSLQCNHRRCTATVENDCRKFNGNDVTVRFTLKSSSEEFENSLVSSVSYSPKVTIGLRDLDLLPFTNYTVIARLANNAGVATDPSLTKEVSIITKPEEPGRVGNLAVTQATPSSLHVVWTAPDDNPPKGQLSEYKLLWMVLGTTLSAKTATVNENVTSFTITGLEPSTSYIIKISAKNANTNRYGEGVSVTATTNTEKDGCVDEPPTPPTTSTHRPPPVVQPPPLPPLPPQTLASSQQQQYQAITSHYGRGIDHYGRGIDAYVAHLAFLERYLTQQTAQE